MPQRADPVKVALADLVFEASRRALTEFVGIGGSAVQAAHTPLEDYVFKFVPISNLESIVIAEGPGGPRYYSIKVHEDKL